MNMNNTTKELRFLIADDHPAIRSVLRQIIQELIPNSHNNIDEVSSIAELSEIILHKKIDMAVLDVHLEDGITLSELPLIKMKQPDMKILYFSVCPEDIYAQRLIQMGAHGFVNKKAKESELSEAISKVLAGRRYLSPEFMYALMLNPETAGKADSNPFLQLSAREFEVTTLMLNGKTNKEIAEQINLSASTISSHKSRIFEKLRVENEMELSKIAGTYGITSL